MEIIKKNIRNLRSNLSIFKAMIKDFFFFFFLQKQGDSHLKRQSPINRITYLKFEEILCLTCKNFNHNFIETSKILKRGCWNQPNS